MKDGAAQVLRNASKRRCCKSTAGAVSGMSRQPSFIDLDAVHGLDSRRIVAVLENSAAASSHAVGTRRTAQTSAPGTPGSLVPAGRLEIGATL